jgi:hypothetical protein
MNVCAKVMCFFKTTNIEDEKMFLSFKVMGSARDRDKNKGNQ